MGKEQSRRQDHKQDGSPRTEKTDPSAQRMRAYQNWRAVVPGPHLRTPGELLFYESDILIGPDITYRIKADEESDPPTEDEIRTWVQKNLASAGLLALDLARVEADIRNAVMTLRQDPAARARLRELLDRLDQTSSRSEKRELGVYPPSIESPTRTPQGLTDHESADDQIPSATARPQVPPIPLELITLHEAATEFGLSQKHLMRLVKRGKIDGRLAGGLYFTTAEAVRYYIENEPLRKHDPMKSVRRDLL